MIVADELELNGIVYFKKKTVFKFVKGLTFIQGRNLQRRGPQASNGSGKSLLFGVLPNLMFDEHPTITKNSRSVQKQIYNKGGHATLRFASGKNKWDYTKTGSKVKLLKNGKDVESRIARDQLKSLLDFTSEEFFSTVYLDSRRGNTFQMGTSTDRYAYITNLFRLHNLDDFRKHVNKQISTLKGDESVLAQTEADLADATQRLAAIPATVVTDAAEASAWLNKATTRLQSLQALVHQHETYSKYTEALAALAAAAKPTNSAEKLRNALRRLDRYEAQLESWTEQIDQRDARMLKLKKLKTTDADLNKMSTAQDNLKAFSVFTKPRPLETDRDTADKYAAKDIQVYTDRRVQVLTASKIASRVLAKFDRELGDSDDCPTCHSPLSPATKKSVRATLKAAVTESDAQLPKIDRIILGIEAAAEWKRYDEALTEYNQFRKAYAVIDGYDFEGAQAYRELKRKLDTPLPDKPEPVTVDRDRITSQLAQWKAYDTLKDRADALRCDEPEGPADAEQIQKLQRLIQKRMSGLSELQSHAADYKSLIRQVKELKLRRTELTTSIGDLPVYKMLTEAYSTAGLKTVLTQRIGKALEANLNRYAKMIYSEDFSFAFEVGEGQFNVFVHRKSGEHTTSSDIRMMSGAESRLFNFLFVLALLPLMPDNRRMNFLIMDEPDQAMDPETKEIFRDHMIPLLTKVVPTLIVISPNSDIMPQHARCFTVVKNHGESTLIKGTYESVISTAAVAGAKSIGRSKEPHGANSRSRRKQ